MRRIYTIPPPVRSPKYLAYVRSFPCVVPGCRARYTEAAHTGGHGLSQKASDLNTIPLCKRHHKDGNDALDKIGRVKFEKLHGVDIAKIIARLNSKPRIRVEGGKFLASIDGEEFQLRPVEDGIRAAVRSALSICRELRIQL